MAEFSSLNDKVSLEDIDVAKYRAAQVSQDTSTKVNDGSASNELCAQGYNNHEITYKIDNSQSAYNLIGDTRTFADWGSFSGSPQNVLAKQSAEVCKCRENAGFWTGAAGMIGFTVSANNSSVYLRFSATDPYWSGRNNRTMVELTTSNKNIDQSNYNRIYDWGGSASISFAGKTLSVTSTIGNGAECTGTYFIKVE